MANVLTEAVGPSCPRPSFTEQASHATLGGGIVLAVLILAVAAVVIVWFLAMFGVIGD